MSKKEIAIDLTNMYKEGFKNKHKNKLNKIYKKHLKYLKKHATFDGWDISTSQVVDDVLYDFFGEHVGDIVMCSLARDLEIREVYHNGSFKIKFNNRKEWAYYDMPSDEIRVTKNLEDINEKLGEHIYLGVLS